MSRALFVSEILSEVISHVNITDTYHSNTAESRRSLLALALTCRSFSEQALDALWESLTGINPVMQCAGIVVPDILTRCDDSEDCRIVGFLPLRKIHVAYLLRRSQQSPRWSLLIATHIASDF
jgi:hypothetical protein